VLFIKYIFLFDVFLKASLTQWI